MSFFSFLRPVVGLSHHTFQSIIGHTVTRIVKKNKERNGTA